MQLEQARAIVDHVVAQASGAVSVFVADTHGELVAAATMDGAAPDTRLNAQRKAYTAARSDARPLRRTIQKEILDPLSIDILEGKVREGQTVKIDAKNGALEFREK